MDTIPSKAGAPIDGFSFVVGRVAGSPSSGAQEGAEMVGPQLLVTGAPIVCSFGTTPATLVVTPSPTAPQTTARQLAVVTDTRPVANVPSFGMCTSPANPAVQAATAAASGVFTPAPCLPATGSPWAPGATAVRVNGVPAVPLTAQCHCLWSGIVGATAAGQVSVSGT